MTRHALPATEVFSQPGSCYEPVCAPASHRGISQITMRAARPEHARTWRCCSSGLVIGPVAVTAPLAMRASLVDMAEVIIWKFSVPETRRMGRGRGGHHARGGDGPRSGDEPVAVLQHGGSSHVLVKIGSPAWAPDPVPGTLWAPPVACERGKPHALSGPGAMRASGDSAARAYPAAMPQAVIGREGELGVVDAFLAGLSSGPAALVLAGPAGVGKTTLLRAGLERAAGLGYTVLRTVPSRSDMRLAFAGLADLLGARLDAVLPELPVPQRRALGAALLIEDAPPVPPDPRVIAAAFRTALLVLAVSAPVLVVIDDVQWLDAPTGSAVGFALRRLEAERVGLLCAQRTSEQGSELPLELDRARLATEVVPVGGLSLGALHRLLRTRLGMSLSHPALRRVHAESAGNPFIALEIGRALARRGITRVADGPLPIPDTLSGLVGERLRRAAGIGGRCAGCGRGHAGRASEPLPRGGRARRRPGRRRSSRASWRWTPENCVSPTRCWPRRSWGRFPRPGAASCMRSPHAVRWMPRRRHATPRLPPAHRPAISRPSLTTRPGWPSAAVLPASLASCWSSLPR